MIKTPKTLGIQESVSNLIKGICETPGASSIRMARDCSFRTWTRDKKGYPHLPLLFSIVWCLAREVMQGKKEKAPGLERK